MRSFIVLGLMACSVGPLAAQHQEHQGQGQQHMHMQMQGRMQGQMQGRMQGQMQMAGEQALPGPLRVYEAFAPAKVLEAAEQLGLTESQTEQLKAIAARAKTAGDNAHAPAHAAMMSAQAELAKADPDTSLVHDLVVAHATAEGNMQWIRVSAALQVQAVLTAEQRAKLTAK
ncbi:MAG: Spy/CpxP family protein refolding chaperone [Gemmatimonadota bacterium]